MILTFLEFVKHILGKTLQMIAHQFKAFMISPFDLIGNALENHRVGFAFIYKDTFPIKCRTDLELMDESIEVEINLNRTTKIYLLSYRSPSQTPFELYGKIVLFSF